MNSINIQIANVYLLPGRNEIFCLINFTTVKLSDHKNAKTYNCLTWKLGKTED